MGKGFEDFSVYQDTGLKPEDTGAEEGNELGRGQTVKQVIEQWGEGKGKDRLVSLVRKCMELERVNHNERHMYALASEFISALSEVNLQPVERQALDNYLAQQEEEYRSAKAA